MEGEKLEKKFRSFLDKNNCWNRANKKIHNLFRKEFNLNLRTFQRWRRNLLLGISMLEDSNHKYRKIIDRNSECYFCETKKELSVHHIDQNRDNNMKENLLLLCPKCHHRLHRITTKKTTDETTPILENTYSSERGLEQNGNR